MEHWGPPSPTWGETGLFLARNMGVLYAGALPLLLVLGLIRTGAAFDREIRFVTLALAVMLLYALGWYTPAFKAFWHLPGVDLFRRPADAVFILGGLFAILAGYGAHRLITGTLATTGAGRPWPPQRSSQPRVPSSSPRARRPRPGWRSRSPSRPSPRAFCCWDRHAACPLWHSSPSWRWS